MREKRHYFPRSNAPGTWGVPILMKVSGGKGEIPYTKEETLTHELGT